MRTCAWIAVVAACGGSSASTDGGGGDGPPGEVGVPTCDAPPTFADGRTPARILHVAAGAAPGGDGSAGAPFQDLEQAAAAATPGTAIRLGPGTHATGNFIGDLHGTAEAPIWIGGEPGQPLPVFAGGAQAMQLSRPRYVVVHDLELRDQTANGINIDDGGDFANDEAARFVALVHLYVHDVGDAGNQDCIKVSGINDLFVYDSRIERCGGGGSGIDHVGCHRSVIARNVFDANGSNAIQAKGGSTDIDIRQNRIRDGGERAVNLGGSTDLALFRPPLSMAAPNAEARRIRVFDNIITNVRATAAPFAFVGCVDCLVAHNFVRGTPRWMIRILQETATQGGYEFEPARNGRVINNSFVFTDGALATACNVGGGTDAASFTFSSNLWHASDAPGQSTPMLPVAETGAVIGMGTGYASLPDDPRAPLGQTCVMAPERGAGAALPETTGTVDGSCRTEPRAIGPQTACN